MPMILQERDKKLLQFLFVTRVSSYQQIRARYFSGQHPTIADRRIRLLAKNRLVRTFPTDLSGKTVRALSLTENGWEQIKHRWPVHYDNPHFKSESVNHDIRLGDAVSRFLKLKTLSRYLSENMLQSSSTFASHSVLSGLVHAQSDGALEMKDPAGRVYTFAVEFEISLKAKERYRHKLSTYYAMNAIDGVLYICGGHEITDCLSKIDTEVRTAKDSIVYFADEFSVSASDDRIFFKRESGKGLSLV